MKKTYQTPEMETVRIDATQTLLDASPLKLDNTDASVTGGYYDDI